MIDVDGHIAAFNRAVRSGEWEPFVDLFADDATLVFVGPAAGPYQGRPAIAAAYRDRPPDDTMTRTGEPTVEGDELVVPYRWDTGGGTGALRFVASPDDRAQRLTVTFD